MGVGVWLDIREDEDEEGVLDMIKNLGSDTKINQQ